jgi:hypothetical protein
MSNKLRVIQSKGNGFVTDLGQLCFSGLKSFTDTSPREARLTLFIHSTAGKVEASVFESVYSGERNADGQYTFVTVTTPVIRDLTGTDLANIHLMAPLALKEAVVDYVLA